MTKSATEEAIERAQAKIKQSFSGGKGPAPSAEAPEPPFSPEQDALEEMFPDSPKEKEPEEEPEVKYPTLDCKLSFACSAHGPQALKEVRYTTIVLACGCEWVYDCGYLSQLRRGANR